jgi:hypothetical protein
VTLGSDNITITGDVNLVDAVRINNTESQMIPIYLVGNVLTVNQGTTPWYANANVIGNISGITTLPAIRGNVNVDNFPSNVSITQMPAITGNVGVSGNVSITQMPAVSGNVWVNGVTGNIAGITTLPAVTGNVGVSGNVSITTMPGIAVTSMPEVEIKNDSGNPIPVSANTTVNSLANPISIQITKNGLAVSDTVGLPTRVINDEELISYARGKAVTEAEVLDAFLIDKSGATAQMGITPETMTTVWGATGLYPWTTFTGTGAKIYIKSVTNDPKVQGKSVTIEGLDSNYDILIETVTLHATDTTTPVSTVNNFYRTNKMYLSGANTNSLPHDYNIELRYGSSSGTIIGQMNAPWGRGQNCFYTVPRGYEGFVLSINGNSGKADEITSSLWFHPYGGTWTLQKSFKFISGMFDHNFRTPLRISEKSDVEIRAYALVESSRIGTEFQMLILPKA